MDHTNFLYINTPALLLSIITITLNIFVIRFYWKSEKNVVSLLYTAIASLDILTAIGIIHFYVIILIVHFKEDFIDYTDRSASKSANVNVMILSFFIQISCRCSVFCNLVLAVSRTVMILKPFYQINIKLVKLTCVLYAVPWIVMYGLNLHEFYSYYAVHATYGVGFLMGRGLSLKITEKLVMSVLSYIIYCIVLILPDIFAFIIPVIIVIVTCVIQVISLHRSSQFPTSSNQRHVTITILIMSTVFVLCNSPFASYHGTVLLFILTRNSDMFETWAGKNGETLYHISTICAIMLPILNAVLNPVIIISRSSGMRRKFTGSIQRMFRCIRERLEWLLKDLKTVVRWFIL